MIYRALTIDPGVSNGVCEFTFGDAQPFKVERLWQFKGGAEWLGKFIERTGLEVHVDLAHRDRWLLMDGGRLDHLIVEKFTPRQNEGFNLTLDDVEPLRGEGALISRGFDPFIQWREPSQQYFMGGEDLADRRKRARAFLAEHDLLPTGSDVGQPDANDAISATLHSIAWLRRRRHMPTIEALFPRKDEPQ